MMGLQQIQNNYEFYLTNLLPLHKKSPGAQPTETSGRSFANIFLSVAIYLLTCELFALFPLFWCILTMLSVRLLDKLFRIKQFVSDSTASHVILPKIQFLHGTNNIFMSFCSLEHDLSGVCSRTEKKGHKFAEKLLKQQTFAALYLMTSCGLSPEAAVSATYTVFDNMEKPNSVLAILNKNGFSSVVDMLKKYGFNKTHIAAVVRYRPRILEGKEQTILSKFEFFHSIGLSKTLLAFILSEDPCRRRIENRIIYNYNFLKSILITDERVASVMKRTLWMHVKLSIAPNIKILREHEVPESHIKLLLTRYPKVLINTRYQFKAAISRVSEIGFSPLKMNFVLALHAIDNLVTYEKCRESYKDWGWSDYDIFVALKKHPNCMIMSQEKISRTMDFLVNKMGFNSRLIASCPVVLFFSLEKRIIPRCSVIQVLSSRGLITKEFKLSTVLLPSEKYFLEKFVLKYEKEVPQLHDFYKGKVGVEEL